jgi:hypothetical protein
MKIRKTGKDGPAVMNAPPATPPADRAIPVVLPTARSARRQAQDRKSMLDRAIGLVERAQRSGTVLDIDAETENLLHDNPNCRMSFAELRADFATVASAARVF